jgi:sirohydrochlorin cobaltochelatase
MQAMDPSVMVRCAFLELTTPDLPMSAAEVVALGAKSITVVPMFLGVGKHAREDLPVLMEQLKAAHPEVTFLLQPAVGEQPRLVELLAQMALDMQASKIL